MKKILFFMCMTLLIGACSKDEDKDVVPPKKLSNEKELLNFTFSIEGKEYPAVIEDGSVKALLPSSVDITALTPEIVTSDKSTVSPASKKVMDFSKVVDYTVTAEDKTSKNYKVYVTKANSANFIERIVFKEVNSSSYKILNKNPLDIDTIAMKLPYLSPVKNLTSEITVSDKATLYPESGKTLDYTKPVKYTVTAQDGTKKEYLVIINAALDPLKIRGVDASEQKSGIASFRAEVLNPIKDSIKVKLVSVLDEKLIYDLSLNSVDYNNKIVKVNLPKVYENGRYKFIVSIEHNNKAETENFVLNYSKPSFRWVNDAKTGENNTKVKYQTLLIPNEKFSASLFIANENLNNHKFYLRKNGVDYALIVNGSNFYTSDIDFKMPNLPTGAFESGKGFEFVVVYNSKEYVFPFVNSSKESIDVKVAQAPIVTPLSFSTIKKESSITINGKNLMFPARYSGSDQVRENSYLVFSEGGSSVSLKPTKINSNGSLTFQMDEYLSAGVYDVTFESNVKLFAPVKLGSVTVELSNSEHPRLKVTSAEIYGSLSALPKQLLITFNEKLNNAYPVKIVILQRHNSLTIENFMVNSSTVLTGALPNYQYSVYHANAYSLDGYVIIKDNQREYKVPFELSRAN